MKKFFEEAEMEVVKFNNADVITTSDIEWSDISDPNSGEGGDIF